MGQSLSRRPAAAPTPTSTSTSTPVSEYAHDAHKPRRSLPRRILSSLPRPSLRSRPPSSSLALPTRPEQTLRGKKRRWGLSRRHNISPGIEGAIPEPMHTLEEHDEHQVDRDVDEFGVITHRVPDSHSDSQVPSAKGKEKARDIPDIEDQDEDNNSPAPSSSAAPPSSQSEARANPVDHDQVIISPTDPPSLSRPPSPAVHDLERPPSVLTPLPMSQTSTNTVPRPFPPPGTLVVVQGVVHTTDVPRPSERPATTSNPTPPTSDALNSNTNVGFEASPARPTSLPTGTRSRNPLSGIFPRPTSMVSAVPSSLPSDSTTDSSATDSQTQQITPNVSSMTGESENEDSTHVQPHGIAMTQGPIGAAGLSASSIDVLGTLLSVAAAATAASLLTGSSEPIFSSGLTSSQPPPSSDFIPQPAAFNPNVPSERPLSPTPTSDAGRMRHVWSSLRDRLGLGSSAHNSNHPQDTTSSLGLGQNVPSLPSDAGRLRDPRQIMLAEMARAFNLGLGLGGVAASSPSAVVSPNSHTAEGGMLDNSDILAGDRNEEPPLPPPDSFERFLMDLQTDLRVTLMQEQDPGVLSTEPRNPHDTAEDGEGEDQRLPELQSLSDSDSEEFETRGSNSGNEDEPDCERTADEDMVEEDMYTVQEELSGRASPAVSGLGTDIHSSFGVRTGRGSTASFQASGMFTPHVAPSQAISTAISLSATDNHEDQNTHAAYASSGVAVRIGTPVPISDLSPSEMCYEEEPEGAVSGVAHSPGASNEAEAEGPRVVSGDPAVLPHDSQDTSNVPGTETGQESLLGVTSLSVPLTSSTPDPPQVGSVIATQDTTQQSTWTSPLSSDPELATRNSSSASPPLVDSSMPFRLPFTSSSASRTEHTPGGGINWWRMYRFPAVNSPNLGQPGGVQGPLPLSQTPFRSPAEGPSHSSTPFWARTDQSYQNEMITPRVLAEVPGVHSGLAAPVLTPTATSTDMPELVPASNESPRTPLYTNGQDSNASLGASDQRSNAVVPVIVVGLQSVNMDRQPPHTPHPQTDYTTAMDGEEGEGMDLDTLEQTMSTPLHIPEPAEFRHHSLNTVRQEQSGQQQTRGRTWQSRAANAFRNLRPSRRNADTTSPQPQETPGSRTFLIYVIGGYYPPDHQIITGGNVDSFEALWELAELLGQVKPPTVSKEEIERSGLEIIKASVLAEYEKQGRIASNCVERCLICLDDYNPADDLRVLTCKHVFHQGCVDRWLETGRNNCPACRTKGVTNQDA